MKKIILTTMLFCAFSATAFAECAVDYKTDTVTISGNAEGRVGITVFSPGMWFDDIEENIPANNVVSYNMQTTADEDGVYTFSFRQKDETGLYRYSAASENGDSDEGEFVFVSTGDREHIVNTFINAKEKEIPGICETYGFELEIEDSIFSKADKNTVSEIIADYIDENPFDTGDFRRVSDVVNAAYHAGAAASGNITDTDAFSCVYPFVDERIYEWMSSDKITDLRKKAIINAMKGSYDSFDDFSDKFIEKLVLYVVEQPNGMSNLKEVIEDFRKEIDVNTGSLKNSNYNNVSGKLFGSLSELEKALAPSDNKQSSGGGGGGGGSVRPSDKNNAPAAVIGGITTDTEKTETVPIMKFEDIDSVSWAYEAIASLAKDGIVSGKSETIFDPMGNVTREEFVKMLVGVMKFDAVTYLGGYNDVQSGAWYANFVETATKNNLCHGIGGNNFGVGLPITRQDMCVMIYNAIKDSNTLTGGENTFVDGEKIADYAKEAVLGLAKLDLVHGNDNKEFLPANNTTRAEAAVLLNSLKKYMEGGVN